MSNFNELFGYTSGQMRLAMLVILVIQSKFSLIMLITKSLQLETIGHRSKPVFSGQLSFSNLPPALFSFTGRFTVLELKRQNMLSFLNM